MVSGTNFYIYGGGRWREVDITDGRVEGWGRARFAYAKRGKVNMAKTRAVLTALLDLRAGKKSAVKDGARLPCKTYPDYRPHPTSKIDAAVQTRFTQNLIFSDRKQKSNKRCYESTSSDDNVPTQLTTTALVNSSPNKLGKLKLKRQCSITGYPKPTPKRLPSLKLNTENSSNHVVLPKSKDTKEISNGIEDLDNEPKHTKKIPSRLSSISSMESQSQKNMREIKSVTNFELKGQNDVNKSKSAPNAIKNIDKETQKSVCNSGENVALSQLQLDSEASKTKLASQDKFKELIIGEDDVVILRNYLLQHASDFDLLQYDQSDEYKCKFFYSINPLVNVERCPKIARMLARYDSHSEISLKDFATQLGLASVAEKRVPQRYKMRHRDENSDKSDNDTDKENETKTRNGRNNNTGYSSIRYTTDTELDSDFEEIKERRQDNRRRSLRGRNEINPKNDVKEKYSPRKKSTKSDNNSFDEDSSVEEDHADIEEIKERRQENRRRSLRSRKEINPKNDVKEKYSPRKKSTKSDNNSFDEDSSVEEDHADIEEIKERRQENRRRSLRSRKEINPKNDVKAKYSPRKKSTKPDNNSFDEDSSVEEDHADIEEIKERRQENRRRSLRSRKEINPKNDVKKKYSPRKKSTKSDNNSFNEDSSVEEVHAKVLRKRKTAGIANDSEKFEEQKKIRKHKLRKRNNSSSIYTSDLTNSTEDSDSISDAEQVVEAKNGSNSNRNITDTDNRKEEVRSTKEAMKIKRNQIKDGNKKTTANQIDSNDANGETSKITNDSRTSRITKLFGQRNEKGRFQRISNLQKKDKTSNDNNENSEVQDKSLKAETRKHTESNNSRKLIDSDVDNSKEQFEPRNRSRNKNKNNGNKNDANNKEISEPGDNSGNEFENKSKHNQQKTKRRQNTFEDNSEEKFERKSRNGLKRRQNEINHVRNNALSQNKNTDTNNETSGADKHKKQNKTDHKLNNGKNKNTKETIINHNGNQSETNSGLKINIQRNVENKFNENLNESAKTVHLSSASKNDALSNMKLTSLVAMSKDVLNRPASSGSIQRMEYSNLEDHAIVSWISNGDRARCVNGNRIWRELQDQFLKIAGQRRTWHSLRNRYLRSILPRLGQLALDSSLIARLRAAAATGEIKSRKEQSRRNSIFGVPVLGALSRKPRARSPSIEEEPPRKKHKHDHSRKPSTPTSKTLRSAENSSVKPVPSPRYSEITRHFARKNRESTPISSTPSPERKIPTRNSLETRKSERHSLATRKSETHSLGTRRSERHSLATKESKNLSEAERPSKTTAGSNSERKNSQDSTATKMSSTTKRSSPAKSLRRSPRVKSPENGRTKSRKLFNPNSMI